MPDASSAHDLPGSNNSGPHAAVPCSTNRERFTLDLFDRLWSRYRQRVPHVAGYESLIAGAGDCFRNDHIAFRTFGWQSPQTGIASLSRIFDALGYRIAGTYDFAGKHLTAVHMAHPVEGFPLLFISELKCWELSVHARRLLAEPMSTFHEPATLEDLEHLSQLDACESNDRAELLDRAASWFEQLPWAVPERAAVEDLNHESQYAAWVLVHGFAVNHFTALINSHQSPELDDLEKTVAALREAGVPMKDSIEGERGSRLRQTATAAAMVEVPVLENGQLVDMPWTYAYFELAERGTVCDAETGEQVPFRGFLGPQATQLFEMTRKAGGQAGHKVSPGPTVPLLEPVAGRLLTTGCAVSLCVEPGEFLAEPLHSRPVGAEIRMADSRRRAEMNQPLPGIDHAIDIVDEAKNAAGGFRLHDMAFHLRDPHAWQ